MPQVLRVLAVLGSLTGAASYAQDTRVVIEPVFPPVCTSVAAQLTAGSTGLPPAFESLFDTGRIQSALNACPAGKAVELQTSGPNNAFLMAPITLPKGVTLLVDAGVTVFASRNPRDYDADASQTCGDVAATGAGCKALITAYESDGSGLMGYGTIDGRGQLPMLINGVPSPYSWWDMGRLPAPAPFSHFPKIVQVTNTNNFTIYKITLINGMGATCHVGTEWVTNFTAWGIKIIAPDGMHASGMIFSYSSNITVADSYISDGDDIVAVSATTTITASNITVINCHFGDGHGLSIGSYTQAGVSNALTLNASASNATVGDTLTLTAVVAGSGGIPSGSVTFMNGDILLASVPLDSSGTANYTTNSLPGGTNTITATYGGDVLFAASAATPVVLNLSPAASSVILAADNAQIAPGKAVTFTAQVSVSSNPLIPTGTLDFVDGSTVLATVQLDASGAATYTTDALGAGVHSFVGIYSGDCNFGSATSPVVTVQVGDPTG